MGRLKSIRRFLGRRPLLVFGLLLLGPAAGITWLGWRGVTREADLRRAAAERDAEEALEDRVEGIVAALETLRTREESRPYFEYQAQFLPADLVVANLGLRASPLARETPDPRLLGWFQWERTAKGVHGPAEILGPDAEPWREGFEAAYGDRLRGRLAEAADGTGIDAGRQVDYPLFVVRANEERGQILEEYEVVQEQLRRQAGSDANPPAPSAEAPPAQEAQVLTPYIESFLKDLGTEAVPVRYGPMRYMARPAGESGPPLVAWRLVSIEGLHQKKRAVARDRWLLQGYVLDPGRSAPAGWERLGDAFVGPAAGAGEGGAGAIRADLADALGAESWSEGGHDPSLLLVARPDLASVEAEDVSARGRFLLLAGGLFLVVGIGFGVLLRSVRREVALARRKQDFVDAVTHELKTPLTGIRMYAEMLREGWVENPEAAARYANRIVEESARLGGLVEQVLTLAALDRGLSPARLERGDLGAEVRAAAESMAPRAREAGVDLRVEVPEGLPPAPRDPRLVRPLVLNLLDNAIKYSERSAVKTVVVSLAREGDRLVLRVADRGVGIPARVLARLFEPFARGEDEMTRRAPGVGIGLALVKRYADAHQAPVGVESAEGSGTTVSVRFPA